MIPNIIYQFIKQAVASDEEILAAASKYYDNDDPEDPKRRWDHVLDDIEVAKKIRGRDLNPVELATLAFHDSGYKNPKGYMWGLKHHPSLGRKIFKKEAPGLGFSKDEIKHMAKVISYHMRTPKKGSPLLKDDLQMLMFGADEGSPKKPVDDARKYFMKAIAGRYPEVPDKKHPDFIKKLVERVRTFKDYSNAPGLEYYHKVYPNYHKDLYNYWHSDQIIKDYEKMLEDDKKGKSLKQKSDKKKDEKKNDKFTIHGAILGCLGDNANKFKYNITEDLPGDPWGAIINTDPVDAGEVRKFHSYHNIDVDGAGVPYYFLTKNERTGDKYVWYSDDAEPIRINTKEEKELAKKIGLKKGLVSDQLDFKFTEKKASKSDKKRLEEARKFVEAVRRIALKKKLNFFLVTDGASGISNKGNPAVRNAREAQIKWELENGSDPYEDWVQKKASKLYTYVEPDADLSKGILSARLAPEDVLLRRYPGRAKNKEELLALMQERLDDKDRPDLIYALSEPIPNRATEKLRRFRDARKLVSYNTEDIKDLIKILKRNYRKPPSEVKDVERKKYIQWGRKPKDGGAFFYAPVYKLLTESGKIDPELLTIEE